MRSADAIAVVSRALKDRLTDNGFDETKILVNPNGVDPALYTIQADGNNVRRKYNLDEKIVVGCVSTFGPWHGLPVLVDAVEDVVKINNNIHFLLIGDGELRNQVEKTIRDKNLEPYVTLTGIIPHKDVPEYLAACDILVSPHPPLADGSEFFGSPTKLFEYMATGKGIVASNLGQIGEVLKNDCAFLVEPGDKTALAPGDINISHG